MVLGASRSNMHLNPKLCRSRPSSRSQLENTSIAKFSISEDKKRDEQRASWLINSFLMVIREWDTGQAEQGTAGTRDRAFLGAGT